MLLVRLFTVDCFTERPFAGNPTAVCLLDSGWPATGWLQLVAAELNLPATAFVDRGQARAHLRWFSPKAELDLCGSGTLAAAHVMWETGETAPAVSFDTRAGELNARLEPDGRVTLGFPGDEPWPVAPSNELGAALGATPLAVCRGRLDLIAELDSAQTVRMLVPDLVALAALDARGVIVTAKGDSESDFVSRFFAPRAGIDEDPVTGSAHCTLGAYWSKKLDKTSLTGLQVSARGGRVDVHLHGDCAQISGHAVVVARGELLT